MKLKTLSKMNVYGKYIMNWYAHIVDAFFILFFFLLMVGIIITVIKFMYKPDFFNVIGDYAKFLLMIDFYICIVLHLIWCVLDRFFDSLIEKRIPFIISKNDKMIIMHLINQIHNKNSHIKLCLELIKLEKVFNNKSDIYNKFSEDDFPCIHKFIRRFKKSLLQSEKQMLIKNILKKIQLTPRNIENLNLPIESPNLPTLDVVDNELNDLIYHQMNTVKNEKLNKY